MAGVGAEGSQGRLENARSRWLGLRSKRGQSKDRWTRDARRISSQDLARSEERVSWKDITSC